MRQRVNAMIVGGTATLIAFYSIRPLPTTYDTGGVIPPAVLYHAAAYFVFASALLLYFHDTPRGHIEAILAAVMFGIVLESVQLFLPGRLFSLVDITANTLGASIIVLDHRSRLVTRVIATEDRLLDRVVPGDHIEG